MPMKPSTTSILGLERFVAASVIFYYHVGLYTGWPGSRWGEYAVSLFIIQLGYTGVRFSRGLTLPCSFGTWRAYLWKRFWSIYPTFAVISIAIFAGSALRPAPGHAGPYSVGELISNSLTPFSSPSQCKAPCKGPPCNRTFTVRGY